MSTLARSYRLWFSSLGMTILCASLLAQAPEVGFRVERSNHLRGTVINSVTAEPVARALVRSPDNRFAVMSDDQGRFEFTFPQNTSASPPLGSQSSGVSGRVTPAPENRPYALIARKPGFLQINDGWQQVQIAPEQDEVTIPLVPEARVVGHVSLAGGEAGDQVDVALYRRDVQNGQERWNPIQRQVRTRSNGEFRFADLQAGTYKLFTLEHMDRDPLTFDPQEQLFGYPPVYYPAASDFQSAAAIHLSAGETFQANLAPERREYYPVKLTLRNGPPGFQSMIEVWPQERPGPGYSLGYNPRDGSIQGSLPNGTYSILIRSYGPTPMSGLTRLAVRGGPVQSAAVLTPGIMIPVTVTEELQHKPEISGSFTNGPGQTFEVNPRRPTYLNLMLVPVTQFDTAQDVGLRQPAGPDDAALVLENVLPGRYHVHAELSVGYLSSMVSGKSDLLREPLVVAPGAPPQPIEITVRDDGGEVQGSVAGASQRDTPSSGLRSVAPQSFASRPMISKSRMRMVGTAEHGSPAVYFLPTSNNAGRFTAVYANSAGEFTAYQLAPGSYRVLAFAKPYPELEFASEEELRRYGAQGQMIEIRPGEKKTLQLDFVAENE